MRRLFEGGAYSSNYCDWQLKSLLHLGQIVITFRTLLHLGQNVIAFRTLLHLGPFITFRPYTGRRGAAAFPGPVEPDKSSLWKDFVFFRLINFDCCDLQMFATFMAEKLVGCRSVQILCK